MNTVSEICTALKEIDACTIIMHRRPDGDTVGSSAALGYTLKKMGKTVRFACSDPITPKYASLLDGFEMADQPSGHIITVDVAAPDMAGRFESFAKQAHIVIDHHGTNPLCGQLNLVRPEAAACGEIMYDILSALMPIDAKTAAALYIAVATDTGCFLHGNTTAATHRVAAALMEIDPTLAGLNRKLFVIKTKAALSVRAHLFQSIRFYADGAAAVMTLLQKTMSDFGASEDDVENLASLPMEIEGVRIAVMLRETAHNRFKISVRTDGSVDAAKLCGLFGGGGHKMAAGCSLCGDEETCRQTVTPALLSAVNVPWTD